MDLKIQATLDQAEQLYYQAKEELCKPEEDVVPYSVCQSSFNSVTNYLNSFILRNGRDLPLQQGIEELLTQCRAIDERFQDLHLSPLYDPKRTEDVWMNMDTAQDFLSMAEKTRKLVTQA